MLYADTGQIRNHMSYPEEERRLACALSEQLKWVMELSPAEYYHRVYKAYEISNKLQRYFTAMSTTLDDISLDLDLLSRNLNELIEGNDYNQNNLP